MNESTTTDELVAGGLMTRKFLVVAPEDTLGEVAEKLSGRRGGSALVCEFGRLSGIPGRWQSGWQTKPRDLDMHDWAEFHVRPWGWLPADPTYGAELKDHPDPAIRDFYFGHQDSYRLIVNTDFGLGGAMSIILVLLALVVSFIYVRAFRPSTS